jgi:hypothetical protein
MSKIITECWPDFPKAIINQRIIPYFDPNYRQQFDWVIREMNIHNRKGLFYERNLLSEHQIQLFYSHQGWPIDRPHRDLMSDICIRKRNHCYRCNQKTAGRIISKCSKCREYFCMKCYREERGDGIHFYCREC